MPALHKEIILLRTPRNSGKSASIKTLWKCLRNRYGAARHLADCRNGDIRAWIRLDDSNIIGFASGGDDQQTVADNCSFFENSQCTICVTACLTRGKTWDRIDAWATENEYGISLHDYVQCKDEQAESDNKAWEHANNEKVRMMFARVKYLIDSSGCDDG